MKTGRHFRFGGWILVAVGLLVATVAAFPGLCAADLSADAFVERYDLPVDPKTALESVLTRDEFMNQGESWPALVRRLMEEAFIKALKWIIHRIPSFGPFDIDDDVSRMILDAQLIGIIVLVAGLVAWLAVRLIKARRRRVVVRNASQDRDLPHSPGSSEALKAARKMAKQGNYRDALIYLFRYVLTRLDEMGRLTMGPGKTNREVLDSIPVEEPLRAPLAEMIPIFNRVRYGGADCGENEFRRFQALCRRVTEGT